MSFWSDAGRVVAGISTGGLSEFAFNPAFQKALPGLMAPGLGALGTAVGGAPGGAIGSALGGGLASAFGASGQSAANAQNQGYALANMQFQQSSAQEAMKFNDAQATRQMDFQREMSNTAHQRAVADLKKAGLNPILTATGGPGASSPVGASGTGVSASGAMGNSLNASKDQVNSALSFASIMTELTKTLSQVALNNSQKDVLDQKAKTEGYFNLGIDEFLNYANKNPDIKFGQGKYMADTSTAQSQNYKINAEIDKIKAETGLTQQLNSLTHLQGLTEVQKAKLTGTNAEQAIETLKELRNQGRVSETQFGETMAYFDRFTKSIKPYLSLIPWFRGGDIQTNRNSP
ncbi:MAG: DNA pilot protein [Microvirus sp.]|nr:MAG: DNA pilot protein [Microvirus sp.]